MSLLCRQAWGRLACLAILAAIAGVLAACGAGPGAKQSEPVKIQEVVFEKVGTDDVKIPLGDKFSGSELTYTATSSDKAVATVAIDNDDDILTVTAIGAGEATITVTAADSQDRTASQTFKVTVKATTSEPEPGAPTVRTGAPGSFDVDQGDTQTVTLSRVFTGEDLEFTVASNDTDVATASEDAGILTITARSPGDATVTVTATNDDGNAAHRITVTVPSPVTATPEPETPTTNNPSSCQSPLTIELNRIAKCKLPSKATLKEPPGGGIEAKQSAATDEKEANIWIIRAHKKGTHPVTIFSGDASPVKTGEITVIVPNSPPTRNTTPDPPRSELAGSVSPYTATALDLRSYFDDADDTSLDADPDIEPLRYSVETKPDSILIDATDGFLKIGNNDGAATLTFEVLEEITEDFQVTIHANDDSGDQSQQSVVLTFGPTTDSSLTPRPVTYPVMQKATGELNEEGTLKVGPRLGVSHTVTFGGTGFLFAETESDKLIAADKLISGHRVTTDGVHIKRQDGTYDPRLPDERLDASKTEGTDYFIIKSTGAVVLDRSNVTLNDTPSVTFQLKKGSTGSIIIEYQVWALIRAPREAEGRGEVDTRKVRDSKTLSISVVTCNSPPDAIGDCK